jgi:TolB protein
MAIGGMAQVIADERLFVRSAPGTGSDSTVLPDRLYEGQRARLLEGPVTTSGYEWWRIKVGRIEGWVAAADQAGVPWLASISNGRIAFVRNVPESDAGELFVMAPDGSDVRQLTDGRKPGATIRLALQCGEFLGPAIWSADGARFLFERGWCEGFSIYLADAAGSTARALAVAESVAWSPDGRRIALGQNWIWFVDAAGCTDTPARELLVMDVQARHPDAVTSHGPCFWATAPTWSRDGRWIAFASSDTGEGGSTKPGVYIVGSEGGGERWLAAGGAPAWSPDGSTILVVASNEDLVLINVADGRVMRLGQGGLPVWSPDGTQIAFSVADDPGPHSYPGIYVVDADGSAPTLVLGTGTRIGSVGWSPDGRQIVFSVDRVDGGSDVAVMNSDGSDFRLLGDGRFPSWEPILYPGPVLK